jgi:glycosyltransferase involved in cell wall biosynthesis
MRREHMLARLARAQGHDVTFLESPSDVRALRSDGRAGWVRRLAPAPAAARQLADGVKVQPRSTLLPGHLNRAAELLDGGLLRGQLARSGGTVVATMPWQWPAVSALRGVRRVLDVADDWTRLVPARSQRIRELFAGREVDVVRNGVDAALLDRPPSAPPNRRRIVYLGTLSERFDVALAGELLDRLPGWTLDLYGPCAYARLGDAPSPELRALVARPDGRARWHGSVARARVGETLDGADVLLLPHVANCRGQDSMKIYDYATRGRPVVLTEAAAQGISEPPPHLRVGRDPVELAALIEQGGREPRQCAFDRIDWARTQSWQSRWPDWSRVLFGAEGGP